MNFRIEKDTLGEVQVPADKLWGAQTERSRNNFKIGPDASMPFEIISAYATLKKAAAITNNNLGVLDSEKAKLIVQVCDEILHEKHNDQFPLVIWQTGSGTQTNMNVNEVIANRAQQLSNRKIGQDEPIIKANDDVNKSQSSNDTFPTAMHIAAYRKLVYHTIPALEKLLATFITKSEEFEDVIKIGRTHLMDATPLTLGQEFSGYSQLIQNGIVSLQKSLYSLSELALGGTAVGTGLNAPENFDIEVAKNIAEITQLPFITAPNKFEALSAHNAIVESHSALKQLAISLFKIANDIRLMGSGPRAGFGELLLPENEPGSSIMPGKVNPTQVEALTMVCSQIIGNDTTITFAASQGQFELNVYKPVIIANFLQSAELLGDACNSFNENCLKGIQPNEKRVIELLSNSLMLVTALNTKIGYYKSAEIAQKAHHENTTLKQAAVSLGYVTENEFDEWVNPKNMI
ncbi:class II fumarate hydratase [Flavobacterium okayamense]|uniref:Fumarate hydratase class II n=1 Tax=Flavobacterium okayamense TaxID=2830782 RepID=A0ABM7S8W1_9FLAO|nr:class II fumarate hydratase [Flavobacterium okayamense]BCY29211.1 fumarate hydratase class II [Flavobacterium okayamense]